MRRNIHHLIPVSDGGVDDGRDGFEACPTLVFSLLGSTFTEPTSIFSSHVEPFFTSALSVSTSFMSSSLISTDCFWSAQEEAGLGIEQEDEEESEVVHLGEEGFSSGTLAVEASVSISFVVSLSVSIGSVKSDTAGGTGVSEPFSGSTAKSTAGSSSTVWSS